MKFIDYYNVMGIAEDASADDIKKAYRKLARKYHPDVSKEKDAEEKFKALGEAYEVLKDPKKRADYDELKRYGSTGGSDFSPPPGWEHLHGSNEFGGPGQRAPSGFSDFFDALFAARHEHGDFRTTDEVRFGSRDIHQRLEITLEEAHHGGTRILQFQPMAHDPHGSTQRTVRVSIPKGIRAGQQIRVKGHGEPGVRGAPPGDLYLRVEFAPHRWFINDGGNLSLVLPVAPWEAVLGAVVTVPTLDGAVKLTIPPNSKAGQKLRLAGKGLHGNPAGDLIVTLHVVVPSAHTDSERALFRALADGIQFNPRQSLES